MIKQKKKVELGMQGLDDINAVLKLDDHMVIIPVALIVCSVFKLHDEQRSGKWRLD
jgi:hypothetical protein